MNMNMRELTVTEDEGFYGYIETSVDPGPVLVVVVLLASILAVSCLPCLVIILDRIEDDAKRRKAERELRKLDQVNTSKDENRSSKKRWKLFTLKGFCQRNPSSHERPESSAVIDDGRCTDHTASVVELGLGAVTSPDAATEAPGSCASESRNGEGIFALFSGFLSSFDSNEAPLEEAKPTPATQDAESDASVSTASKRSTASLSVSSIHAFVEAAVEATPRGRRRHYRSPELRAQKLRKDIKNEARLSSAAFVDDSDRSKSDITGAWPPVAPRMCEKQDKDEANTNRPIVEATTTSSSSRESQYISGLDVLLGRDLPSIAQQLPVAEAGTDSASCLTESTTAKQTDHKRAHGDKFDGDGIASTEENGPSICCGENALWRPKVLWQGFDGLLDLIELDNEMRRLLKLAIPFTLSELIEVGMDAIYIVLIAQLMGTDAVAALAVADLFLDMTSDFVGGVVSASGSILAHAVGAGNNYQAGQYVQQAIILVLIGYIPFIFIWWNLTEHLLLWFGLSQHVADIGQAYARVSVFGYIIDIVTESFTTLYEVLERAEFATSMGLLSGAISLAIVPTALTLNPNIELYQITLMELVGKTFTLGVTICYPLARGWLKPFLPGMVKNCAVCSNRKALKNLVTTALPVATGELLEYGEWEVLTIFAAHLGPAEVATWALLAYVWDIFEATTEGLGDAGEVRVGYQLGKGRPDMAKIAAYKTILLSFIMALFSASILFMIGDDLPRILSSDPAVQHLMVRLLPLVGIGIVTLTFGMTCWALVGAQGRYGLATRVALFSSWVITIPLAAIFTYVMNFDLRGIVCAIILGNSFSSTVLACILLRSDWEAHSRKVREINVMTGEVLDDDSDSASSCSSSSSSRSSSSDSSDSSDSKSKEPSLSDRQRKELYEVAKTTY